MKRIFRCGAGFGGLGSGLGRSLEGEGGAFSGRLEELKALPELIRPATKTYNVRVIIVPTTEITKLRKSNPVIPP
jgi:hypothetical protein